MSDPERSNFIIDIIDADLASGRHTSVVTRFPPEPNGYLHIGHAKAIWINFGLARRYGGRCHLRFDDTNPSTEDIEYVESIQRDITWLGYKWDALYFASDYFEKLYQFALGLINVGKAYVCSLDEASLREYRGTITEPGKDSPFRDRSVEDNLDLFARMRSGEFPDGAHVLRAKIDMAAPNMKLRDPALYRIRHAHHYRTGDDWCIYPLYDFTHGLSDAIEGITHSLCTLEFENNRALYDWFIDNVPNVPCKPRQYESARLGLSNTVMSKRKLLQLVNEGLVDGWDDPRMPTVAAMRRRGIPAKALRDLCEMLGVSKNNSTADIGKLEYCVREALNPSAPRVMCVLEPLKVVIESYPAEKVETIDAASFPHDIGKPGSRSVPFSREIYMERDDFMEKPSKKFYRLAPGREVRLRYAYVIKCESVIKDDAGQVVELRCSHDPDTLDAPPADGRKVKGTIHWVSSQHAVPCQVRLYDRLFNSEFPGREHDFKDDLNPTSLVTLNDCRAEQSLRSATGSYQFERQGYFCVDVSSTPDALVFNRTVTLRDSWAKMTDEPGDARDAGRPQRDRPAKQKKKAKADKKAPPPPSNELIAQLAAALQPVVESLVDKHPDEAQRYRDGKTALIAFFVGQAMRETKGQADAQVLAELFRRTLDASKG